jgi:acetyl esterase/lipase
MPYAYESIYFDDPIIDGRVLDVMMPAGVTRDVALFFVHGGGWAGGSRTHYHSIVRAYNEHGFICASTDYRLRGAGADIFDQITDVRHGYDLFVTRLEELGRPTRIVTHGSSAGAHLNALLSLAEPGECGEALTVGDVGLANDWVAPVGACMHAVPVTFEPWPDILPSIWASMQGIVGVPHSEKPELYRAVSPIKYVDEDVCPVFILYAELEHLFLMSEVEHFVDAMKEAGRRVELKVYPRVEHGFFYSLGRPQQNEAFDDVLAFVESLE